LIIESENGATIQDRPRPKVTGPILLLTSCDYELEPLAVLIAVETPVNVVLAFDPIAWIAVKHTITIKASITAYSTAVGPSSDSKK